MVGRIPITDVMPVVDLGRAAAKATVGEPVPVRATVFREGHDKLGAEVVAVGPDGRRRAPIRMHPVGDVPEQYAADLVPVPVRVDGAAPADPGPAPGPGQHTADVLSDLGYGPDEIQSLRTRGAAR